MRLARWATACVLALSTAVASIAPPPAGAAVPAGPGSDILGVYAGALDAAQLERLRAAGARPSG